LFVPVSGAFGMGEYARSLALAKGIERRWPSASIQFILSREAPYATRSPYPATLLASSPTFHSGAVIDIIERWRPNVAIFDNAGRTAQLRAAKRCGARVVYISARRRQRGKAFRLGWIPLIDEHWIAYPEFIAGSLSRFERLKLTLMRRPVVRYLDVILTFMRDSSHGSLIAQLGCVPERYVLVVPGGGTGHPKVSDAIAQFLEAARGLAAADVETIFVGRTDAAGDAAASRLRTLGMLPQSDLAELMRGARLIIANGGSTLLQSIACGKPCIAVPIADDQRERIRRCAKVGVAVAAPLDSAAIVRSATDLLQNEPALGALASRAIALGLADGVEVAVRAIDALLAAKRR